MRFGRNFMIFYEDAFIVHKVCGNLLNIIFINLFQKLFINLMINLNFLGFHVKAWG